MDNETVRDRMGAFICLFRAAILLAMCLVFAAVAPALPEPQTSQATDSALTNEDIITMVNAGLGQEIVIAKISSSSCDFETAPDKLAALKKAGVPDVVILAMVHAPTSPPEIVYVKCGFGVIGLHAGPSTNPNQSQSYTVAKVDCGDALTSLGEKEGFHKVRTEEGVEGYIPSGFVSKTRQEAPRAPLRPTNSVVTLPSASTYVTTVSPKTLRAIAWRAVPWVTTTYYQRPGNATTDCTGSGTWNGNIWQGNSSCSTQYTPAQMFRSIGLTTLSTI